MFFFFSLVPPPQVVLMDQLIQKGQRALNPFPLTAPFIPSLIQQIALILCSSSLIKGSSSIIVLFCKYIGMLHCIFSMLLLNSVSHCHLIGIMSHSFRGRLYSELKPKRISWRMNFSILESRVGLCGYFQAQGGYINQSDSVLLAALLNLQFYSFCLNLL